MIQISFRAQTSNIKTGTTRNPRQNSQLIHIEIRQSAQIYGTNSQSVRVVTPNTSIRKSIHPPPGVTRFLRVTLSPCKQAIILAHPKGVSHSGSVVSGNYHLLPETLQLYDMDRAGKGHRVSPSPPLPLPPPHTHAHFFLEEEDNNNMIEQFFKRINILDNAIQGIYTSFWIEKNV